MLCSRWLVSYASFMSLDELYLPQQEIQDATCGWRVHAGTGAPTCVHPYRVGLPPALYASGGVALPPPETPTPPPDPTALELPHDPSLLEAWLIAILRCASPDRVASALFHAEAVASERFPARDVVAAMRRIMSHELPN